MLTEYKLNHLLTLKNKIVMAPMTRAKANDDAEPTREMADYYGRRADAGLIITEGTLINATALGFKNAPGIYTKEQTKKWRHVTEAVHKHNGLIFQQLWHVGRVSHPIFLNGVLPISSSETMMTGRLSRGNGLTYGKSRAATRSEIQQLITDYADAANNAIHAGFDGIELHGANGYLIDQFLHYHTNHREDEYGGSPEKMAKFVLDVVNACGEMVGYERVGIRLSPGAYLNEIIGDPRDADVFQFLLQELNKLAIAYVHTGNFDDSKVFPELRDMTMTAFNRKHYHGTVIAAGSYTLEKVREGLAKNDFNLAAIGRPFIANPDLVQKIKMGQDLQNYDPNMLQQLY